MSETRTRTRTEIKQITSSQHKHKEVDVLNKKKKSETKQMITNDTVTLCRPHSIATPYSKLHPASNSMKTKTETYKCSKLQDSKLYCKCKEFRRSESYLS